nr:MAG TPA: hypothetical protein [Caudoviricetes sp.]
MVSRSLPLRLRSRIPDTTYCRSIMGFACYYTECCVMMDKTCGELHSLSSP